MQTRETTFHLGNGYTLTLQNDGETTTAVLVWRGDDGRSQPYITELPTGRWVELPQLAQMDGQSRVQFATPGGTVMAGIYQDGIRLLGPTPFSPPPTMPPPEQDGYGDRSPAPGDDPPPGMIRPPNDSFDSLRREFNAMMERIKGSQAWAVGVALVNSPFWPLIKLVIGIVVLIWLYGYRAGLQRLGYRGAGLSWLIFFNWLWILISIIQVVWPLVNLLVARAIRLATGERRSARGQLVLSVVIGIALLVCCCLPLVGALGLRAGDSRPVLGGVYSQIDLIAYALVCIGLGFFLVDYLENWEMLGHDTMLLPRSGGQEEQIYQQVEQELRAHHLAPAYRIRRVSFTEQGYGSWTEHRRMEQMEITYRRARMTFRAVRYGDDTFVRVDGYLDLSTRRITWLVALFFRIIFAPFRLVTGMNIGEMIATLLATIAQGLFQSRGTTGRQQLSNELPIGNIFLSLNSEYLPSYMADDMNVLQGEVLGIISGVIGGYQRGAGAPAASLALDTSNSRFKRAF